MITLQAQDMELITGGYTAAETWGAQAAQDGLNYAVSGNPFAAVSGTALAIAGAAAYYSGWGYSAFRDWF